MGKEEVLLMKVEILERIENLISSIEVVSKAKNKVEICNKIENLLKDLTYSDFATLFIFDKESQMLYSKKIPMLELSMLEADGCIGKVYLTKSPAIYNHLASDRDYVQEYDNPYNHKLRAQMLIPILEKGELVGVVRVSRAIGTNKKSYVQTDLDALMSIESYLIKIIRTIRLNQQLPVYDVSTKTIQNKIEKIEEKNDVDNKDDILLFLSNTVHDIRTPANSLYGFLELLEEQIEDKSLRKFIINAKESASFINTLTTTILDAAKNKYEASNNTTIETVTTVKFLSDIANTFTARMLQKKIHYFIYISPEIPKEIKIDTLKLKRILMNLIGNAYKFTPIKRQIILQVLWNSSNNTIKFSIKDTGIGIEKKDQEKLFKAFTQAQDNTYEKYGGTGLGLAISAGYVSDLGGKLKLKSEVDIGSEFYFDIPVEIVNNTPNYEKFYDLDKDIVILTDYIDGEYPNFIRKYLIAFGMPEEKIIISNKLKKEATHVICFEEKITSEILEAGKLKKFKLLLVEQKLFSLLKNKKIDNIQITSKNTYNADAIYNCVYSKKKIKVLLVDDNKININLLQSMLSTEFVVISTCLDGVSGLNILKQAAENGEKFDIVYLDEHMPGMLGSDLLDAFRSYEKKNHLAPIYAVSISGDPDLSGTNGDIFDLSINKPFNKNEVRNVIDSFKKMH